MADRIVAGFPFKHSSRYAESELIPCGLIFSDSEALPIPFLGSPVGSCFQKTDPKPYRLTSFQPTDEPPDTMSDTATVTRYPSGCLGLDYRGAIFCAWCFRLDEMLAKTDALGIPRSSIRWQERYFDGDYRIPENYKTRPWNPRADS